MSSIECPNCNRVIPSDSPLRGVGCIHCDSELRLEAPSEQFTFSFAQGLVRFLWSAPALTTVMAGLIAAVFGVFGFCMAIGRGMPVGQIIGTVPIKVLWFFGFSWCFCTMATVPLCLIWCLFGRSRSIWVEGNQLHSRTGSRFLTFDLNDCKWMVASGTAFDGRGYYRGTAKPRIAVRDGKQMVGLGFTEESASRWIEFFESANVERFPSIHWPRYLVFGVIFAVVGGGVGLLVERMVLLFGGPAIQPGALVFLGAVDGGFLLLLYVAGRYRTAKFGRQLGTFVMTLTFFGIALRWCGVLEVAIANAAIGALFSWMFLPANDRSDDR